MCITLAAIIEYTTYLLRTLNLPIFYTLKAISVLHCKWQTLDIPDAAAAISCISKENVGNGAL